jgi:hypothetical protein
MSLIDQVGTQLTSNLSSFATVGLAWTSKPVADFDDELPAAWYYLSSIRSETSPYDNVTIQPAEYEVTVLMVCAVESLEGLMAELKAALVGFQPTDAAFEAFEHVSGDALDVNESIVWWRDVFAVRNYRE